MSRALAYLNWPGSHLREIAGAVAVGSLLLIANLFWQPTVEPRLPAELAVVSPTSAPVSEMTEEESLDFIFRPLFLTTRRPLERVAPEEVVAAQPKQQVSSPSLLEGYQLLGVFSSGGRGGVILLNKAKERVRLFTGDSVEGWELDRTELRSAYFLDAAGGVATLELAVASTLPMPVMAVPSGSAGADVNSAADASSNEDAPPAYDGPVTFESIANRQKQEMEAKAKSRKP